MARVIWTDREPRSRIVVLVTVAMIAALTVFGAFDPAEAQANPGGFEIDGNIAQDDTTTPLDDWENTIQSGEADRLPDPHSKSADDPTVFNSGGKFYKTSTWNIGTGNVGAAQNELTNTAILPRVGVSGENDLLYLALERTKKQGTFALWFELNQDPWNWLDGELTPTRAAGDVAVGFELSGNPEDESDFEVAVIVYDGPTASPPTECDDGDSSDGVTPGGSQCPTFDNEGLWHYRFLGPAGSLAPYGAGEMNLVDIDPLKLATGWESFDAQGKARNLIGPFQFAEAAIDLTALGIDVGCPGYGSAHAATVASLSPTADAKDVVAPEALEITCSIAGTKYKDVDYDSTFDTDDTGLADWPITLYKESNSTVGLQTDGSNPDTTVGTILTCGNTTTCVGAQSTGDYLFTGLEDGTYHVVEAADPGDGSSWLNVNSRSTDGTPNSTDLKIIEGITLDASVGLTNSTGNDYLNAQPPDVKVTKTWVDGQGQDLGVDDSIDAGDKLYFEIEVENLGPGTAQNVTLSDHLPPLWGTDDDWSAKSGTSLPTGCTIVDPSSVPGHIGGPSGEKQHLTCSFSSLAPGSSNAITFTLEAVTTGEDCGTVTNTAVVAASNEPSSNTGNNTSSDTAAIACPDLSAGKSGKISYTLTVTNDSNSNADADGVVVTDNLPGDLTWSLDSAKIGSTPVSSCSITSGALTCQGTSGIPLVLQPGETLTIEVSASISEATAECSTSTLIGNTVSASATNEASSDSSNNSASADICAP